MVKEIGVVTSYLLSYIARKIRYCTYDEVAMPESVKAIGIQRYRRSGVVVEGGGDPPTVKRRCRCTYFRRRNRLSGGR